MILGLVTFSIDADAQEHDYLIVQQVHIEGNNRTKDRIILVEMDVLPGDTIYYSSIKQRVLENEKRILSTGLFTNAKINLTNILSEEKETDVLVSLNENWYIYPSPIFELADRNFNVWWKEQGRDFSRVNYGLRLNHINLTGNRDRMKLVTQFGYTRKYELEYAYPYLNAEQTIGLSGNIFFSENKEMGYITQDNRVLFHQEDDERILLRRLRARASLNYRPGIFQYHSFNFEFHRNTIDDVVTELNPRYFQGAATQLKFFKAEYFFNHDKRIFSLFPQGGHQIYFNVTNEGFGILGDYRNISTSIGGNQYFSFGDKWILGLNATVRKKWITDNIAFANNTGLGYGQTYVRGYELYVQDGTDYFLSKNNLSLKIFDKLLNLQKSMPLDQFSFLMLKAYLSFNVDIAYVREPNNRNGNDQTNRFLIGYGPGLNILVYNTYLFQIEYSRNHLNEGAIFFHNKVSF